jgi:hypothetical protein
MRARGGILRNMCQVHEAVCSPLSTEEGASLVQGSLKEGTAWIDTVLWVCPTPDSNPASCDVCHWCFAVSSKANIPFRVKVEHGGRSFAGSATNGRMDMRWIGVRCVLDPFALDL